MSSLLTLAAFAAALPVAEANERPKNAVHAVIGAYHTSDDAFNLYSPNDALASPGIRLERDIRGPVSLVGTYTRKRVASEYFESLVENNGDPDREEAALVAAFIGQQVTFGPKVRFTRSHALSPYLAAKGLAFFGTSRLDDAPEVEDNANELKARGWAPGFVAAGGVEFAPNVGAFTPTAFMEMGYNWTAQLELRDENIAEHGTNEPALMGDMAFRGFYIQLGMGLRF